MLYKQLDLVATVIQQKIMETYKIIASTNGYIANRDIHFNGRTSYDVVSGLTKEQALAKLEEMFLADYENAILNSDEESFIYSNCVSKIEVQLNHIYINQYDYWLLTKKRWAKYFELTKRSSRDKFEGAGYYEPGNYYGRIYASGEESYEFDSRNYSIELEENN